MVHFITFGYQRLCFSQADTIAYYSKSFIGFDISSYISIKCNVLKASSSSELNELLSFFASWNTQLTIIDLLKGSIDHYMRQGILLSLEYF